MRAELQLYLYTYNNFKPEIDIICIKYFWWYHGIYKILIQMLCCPQKLFKSQLLLKYLKYFESLGKWLVLYYVQLTIVDKKKTYVKNKIGCKIIEETALIILK